MADANRFVDLLGPLTDLSSSLIASSAWRPRAGSCSNSLIGRALDTAARAACVVVLALASLGPTAASAELPPRPEPPVVESSSAPPEIASIQLSFEYSPEWQAITTDWQKLWAIVQWQDGLGEWNDCAGWQGGLDSVADGQASKTFWVVQTDGGKGPFRWIVLREASAAAVAVGDPFFLPSDPSEVQVGSAALFPR